MKKMKKTIFLIVFILFIFVLLYIISKIIMTKKIKIGNNTNSQEIVNYILNISSYEANVEVEIKNNKSVNKYIIKQIYRGPDDNNQEIVEPNNIAGTRIIKKDGTLKIENTDLNLVSLFENYKYISDNMLDLNSFIQDYKDNKLSELNEKEDIIVMSTFSKNNENEIKKLYIDRKKVLPTKMEIVDTNKNTAVYILYNEVKVNS